MSERIQELYAQNSATYAALSKNLTLKWQKLDEYTGVWEDSISGDLPHIRQFIRLAPAPTPERLRVERNLALECDWKKERFPIQFRNHNWFANATEPGPWIDADDFTLDYVNSIEEAPHLEWRRKPEPRWTPWTRETCPVGKVVAFKSNGNRMLISIANKDGCFCSTAHLMSYAQMLEEFQMEDGSRCGTMEVEP